MEVTAGIVTGVGGVLDQATMAERLIATGTVAATSQLMGMAVGRHFDMNAVIISVASSAATYQLGQVTNNKALHTGTRIATTAATRAALSGRVNIEAMASDAFSSVLQQTFEKMAGLNNTHTTVNNFSTAIDTNDPRWSRDLTEMSSRQRQERQVESAPAKTKVNPGYLTDPDRSEKYRNMLFRDISASKPAPSKPVPIRSAPDNSNNWKEMLKTGGSRIATEIKTVANDINNTLNPFIVAPHHTQLAYDAFNSGNIMRGLNESIVVALSVVPFVPARAVTIAAEAAAVSMSSKLGLFGVSQATRSILSTAERVGPFRGVLEETKSVFLPENTRAFSTKAAFEGQLYPPEKMRQLVKYLERRNVSVYGTEGNPAFIAKADGTGQMLLPENPTVLQVKHELSHYLDFRNMGFEAYRDLGRLGREVSVLDRLQQNRVWNQLNSSEREFSINYVERLAADQSKRLTP